MYTPEQSIAILKNSLKLAEFRSIAFEDDVLGIDKNWAFEFYRLYKQEIDLPFKCYVRPEMINDELVKRMKEAGCYRVTFGVETGVEQIRRGLLKKNIKNSDFEKCFQLFKKYGIKYNSTNMMALPGERLDDVLETIKFNAKNGVGIAMRSIFVPLLHTELYKYCDESQLINREKIESARITRPSCLKFDDFSDTERDFVYNAWDALFLSYKVLYKANSPLLVKAFDLFVKKLRPIYPFLIRLREKYFKGKLTSYIYKSTEKDLTWTCQNP
jgi:radical SAM superfamily enzyme YgiQ (UPF0313 family)